MRLSLILLALALLLPGARSSTVLRHPHFPKTVTMSLGFGDDAKKMSVSHLTVTFDRKGFEEMPVGGAWHLANGQFKTEVDVTVGGHDLTAGQYRLLARKAEGDQWELVLDPTGRPFSRDISDEAVALETRFLADQPKQEHLRCDIQPTGDEDALALQLEVHFDTYTAIAEIELGQDG